MAEVLISANRNLDRYLAFGHPVLTDREGGFAGPLAGLHAGLGQARSELLIVAPCDSPLLPTDLVERWSPPWTRDNAEVAVARTSERAHPVFCLCRVTLLDHLTEFFEGGGRKVDAWYSSLRHRGDFEDQADAFRNINTLEELADVGAAALSVSAAGHGRFDLTASREAAQSALHFWALEVGLQ